MFKAKVINYYMCEIFGIINSGETTDIEKEFMKGKRRGPEFSKLEKYMELILGFHRLAMNSLNDNSIVFNNM